MRALQAVLCCATLRFDLVPRGTQARGRERGVGKRVSAVLDVPLPVGALLGLQACMLSVA
jgi:hypothetical protein